MLCFVFNRKRNDAKKGVIDAVLNFVTFMMFLRNYLYFLKNRFFKKTFNFSGTSNDSWTGGSIVSQLNPEILVKIQHCFQDLQPQVKLKLLLSLFHIPRRNLEQWRRELENIITVAKDDSEPWVSILRLKVQKFDLN